MAGTSRAAGGRSADLHLRPRDAGRADTGTGHRGSRRGIGGISEGKRRCRRCCRSPRAVRGDRRRRGVTSASRHPPQAFPSFANILSWSPGPTAWSYAGGHLDQNPELPTYGFAGDHPDQLSGSRGGIRTVFVEIDRPGRVVRGWNWMAPPPVHIRHSGLPAEWVEDLRAWWHYQLAIAEHRGFGTR
jgi:hypothetical protein